jgi:hypothetical protein
MRFTREPSAVFPLHQPENEPQSYQTVARIAPPAVPAARGEVRVFYDISGTTVEVLSIVAKSEAESWLARFADPE